MSRLDDELPSRLVGGEGKIWTWVWDWCCWHCRSYGGIKVKVTGGGADGRTGLPTPKTSNDEIKDRLERSHFQMTRGSCRGRGLEMGRMWRVARSTDGRQTMVIMARKDDPERGISEYRWPPWVQ